MNLPQCHGELSKVFPMGEDGLRATPEDCLACLHKTTCLRAAMAGPGGAAIKEERVDSAYDAGLMGFAERWSRKKALSRLQEKKPRKKIRLALLIICLACAAIAALIWGWPVFEKLVDLRDLLSGQNQLEEFMRTFGPNAPFVFIGAQAAQVVVAPIPGEATGFVGGYLFGTLAGFVYSMIGLFGGSIINFYLGRFLGRRYLRLVMSQKYIERFKKLLRRQGVLAGFLLFVIPGFPKDTLCLVIGMGSMPVAAFAIICAVGRIPGTLLLSIQGASVYDQQYQAFAIICIATLTVIALAAVSRKQIYRFLEQLK